MVQEVIVGQFAKIGARILTSDGIDLTSSDDDPTRRLIRQVLGTIAEFDKNITVLKLRAARERKRSRGERVEGGKPYGFFPVEAAIVNPMRQLRRKRPKMRRTSFAGIAAQLNAEGHETGPAGSGHLSWCSTLSRPLALPKTVAGRARDIQPTSMRQKWSRPKRSWLERGFTAGCKDYSALGRHPIFESLRRESRVQDLVKKMQQAVTTMRDRSTALSDLRARPFPAVASAR
jgi:hypothetical protein